ncbi:hypothetical protein BH20VER3_BH20VER3_07560 [soil metagenome]
MKTAAPGEKSEIEDPFISQRVGASPSQRRSWTLVLVAIGTGALSALIVRPPTSVEPTTRAEAAASLVRSTPRPPDQTETALRFYLARVRRDPEETRSQNALAELYLRRVRETGNEDHLPLALKAARASLASVAAEQNSGGLTALALAEFANHDFAAARDHAEQLVALHPKKSTPYVILGDACLELGDYQRAQDAFQKMEQFGENDASTETRLARLAILRGETESARQHFSAALALLRALQTPPREPIAWCLWQLGDLAFGAGDYPTAERHYRDGLATVPEDFRNLASLGRLAAARGDPATAITHLEQAVRIAPAVDSMAALGDLYHLVGRSADATARYELVAQLGEHSSKVHGTPFNRAWANFQADHDLNPEAAYALAKAEYAAGRRDIYGADALAWTALKADHLAEAEVAIKEALTLGTRDARLFYHAGMIARAAGRRTDAARYLGQALDLNPGFDALQSPLARAALQEVSR